MIYMNAFLTTINVTWNLSHSSKEYPYARYNNTREIHVTASTLGGPALDRRFQVHIFIGRGKSR